MTTTVAGQKHVQQAGKSNWNSIYLLGAIAALSTLVFAILDISVSMASSTGEIAPGTLTVTAWFDLFASDPFRAFRDLGILNIINLIISIPIMYALYDVHRHQEQTIAGLAIIMFLFGGAIYISNNTVLALYSLSQEYAGATSAAQRVSLVAAGEAMLARGADFTPGSFVGFVLPGVGNLMMAYVVLHGRVFSKVTGYVGCLAFSALLIFTIWITVSPDAINTAMGVAMIGGLAVMVWNLLIARRLFQLATQGR